jgi:folate-binding protein YgfZ
VRTPEDRRLEPMVAQEKLFADRSERGKLRLTGPQHAWFLHQILTQAFEDMAEGEARDAAMITAHGRMVGFLETVATADAILAHFEPELVAVLPDEIRRYVFATEVEIEDVTSEMGLLLLVDDDWRAAGRAVAAAGVLHETRSLGTPAGYVWTARAELDAAMSALEEAGWRRASEDELELLRIDAGVARWGRDMDTKSFPQEAGIDKWAVHYDKGCYVGQEAMAKIHFRGKVNKRLRRVSAVDSLQVGSEVTIDGQNVGTVTSAADHRGLALLRHDVEPGARALAGEVSVTVD